MDTNTILNQFQMDYQFRLSEIVLRDYRRMVTQFLNYTEKNPEDIEKKDIRNWMGHLIEVGYKPKTVGNNLGGLKTFFKYCVEEELIDINPAKNIPFPKVEESLPRYLTREQLNQLRMFNEGNILVRAIIEVLYSTGVRISELLHIKHEDINWSERFILIPKSKGKKERIVLFTRECGEYLKRYIEHQTNNSPYVFVSNVNHPNPFWSETIERWFRGYTEQLNFKVTPHTLRHTFAANLARKGMSVDGIMQLLGHDNIHTTRIYAKLYDHARKEQYDEWM